MLVKITKNTVFFSDVNGNSIVWKGLGSRGADETSGFYTSPEISLFSVLKPGERVPHNIDPLFHLVLTHTTEGFRTRVVVFRLRLPETPCMYLHLFRQAPLGQKLRYAAYQALYPEARGLFNGVC